MKLHLPKALCAIVMAMFAGSAMGGTLTSTTYTGEDGQEHTKWDVGVYNGSSAPSGQVTTLTDSNFELNGYDMLGTYEADGNLRTLYGNCSGTSTAGNVSPSVKTTGTVTIKDNAQLSLGGLYTDGQYYIGLIAEELVVDANDNPNIINFRTTGAKLTNVEIKGGTAWFHHAYNYTGAGDEGGTNQGNQIWGSFTSGLYSDTHDSGGKNIAISGSYTQSGGNVRFGAVNLAPHTSSGTKIYYGQAFRDSISQTGGTMNVYGHTIFEGTMLTQSGDGEMNFRDRINLTKSSVTIQQGGDNTAASDKPTMVIGKLFGSPASVILDQTNAGTMTLAYGTNFSKSGTVEVTQSGTGTVNIGGGHSMKNTDLSGFDTTNTTYIIDQENSSGTVNLASNATIGVTSLTQGANATLNINGTLNLSGTDNVVSGAVALGTAGTLNVQGELTVAETATLNFGVESTTDAAAMNIATDGSSIVAQGAAVSLTLTEALTTELDEYFTSEDVLDKTMTFNLISNFDADQLDNLTEGDIFTTPAAVATLATDDIAYEVEYWNLHMNDANDVLQATVTWQAKQIPEPATATLSLLALAGLAARRRRR